MKRTKKLNGLSRAVLSRVLMMVLLLAMVGGVLTSCAGGSVKDTTVKKNYEIAVSEGSGNGLTATQLNTLADAIVKSKNAFTIREQLVAALRGYDMNAADFDDSKIPLPGETMEGALEAHPENAPTYALAALRKAGIETFSYYDADDQPLMTVADVESLVKCFQVTVETKADLGLFDQLLHWIGLGFEWMIVVPGFGSFILGTLYFAIAIEILMLPIGIHQQKNSRKQARLRPKEMAIRNKYKGRNDQATMQKLNQEIQNLYANEGYSPMSGCLPLLITMPFLIFLYYIVLDPLTYMMGAPEALSNIFLTFADAPRAAGGLGLSLSSDRGTIEVLSLIREHGLNLDGLKDFAYLANGADCLSALDGMVDRIPDFTLFGINMGGTPKLFEKPYALMLIPVLTFLVYWGSGKITRKLTFQPTQNQNDPAQGCSNGMMNIMMPAMSAFFTVMVPAAVGVYWMFKSIVGTIKQIVISKAMPLPVFSEEDYKAAERELSGKDKNKPVKKSGTRNPDVRSLHHIDDEDYDTTSVPNTKKPAVNPADKPDYVEPEEPEKPRTAEGAYGDGVTLKEDRPARDDSDAQEASNPGAKKPFRKKNKDE